LLFASYYITVVVDGRMIDKKNKVQRTPSQ